MGGLLEARSSKQAWAAWRNPVSTKISQTWWHVPTVPATCEGESHEPREVKAAMSCHHATALHSSLDDM